MYTKKIVSIILVIAMALSVFAMTASATEIQPRYRACTACGGRFIEGRTEIQDSTIYIPDGCQYLSGAHSHYLCRVYKTFTCEGCGNRRLEATSEYKIFCVTGDEVTQ